MLNKLRKIILVKRHNKNYRFNQYSKILSFVGIGISGVGLFISLLSTQHNLKIKLDDDRILYQEKLLDLQDKKNKIEYDYNLLQTKQVTHDVLSQKLHEIYILTVPWYLQWALPKPQIDITIIPSTTHDPLN